MRSMHSIFKLMVLLNLCFFSFSAFSAEYKAFLWKAQYQRNTVFIAGSIHALSKDFYPLPPNLLNAFKQSQRLAVELDPNEIDPYEAQQLVQSKMWLKEGRSLDQFLSTKHLAQLKEISALTNTPYTRQLKTRPWMLIENLTQYQIKESGYDVAFGVDNYFLTQAKAQNMPILELESLNDQISAIADVPFDAQLAALTISLDDLHDESYLPTMTSLWREGKDDELYQFVYSDVEKTPSVAPMMTSLLDDRNQHMADIIGIYLNQPNTLPTTTFVVVGALHLSGPNSVIQLLTQKGFYIQRN
ncbi:TraB/GumN family protein [Marinomonas mediterranea]|uniref:TraB/GumN family protein n=1 Tax=Marinomonas mediterranea TaxID=119864 RepID=UPI0023499A8D|nr:TraB/GumN family protein [Marinomonas mediterranea]WCN08441.1 hypothetical protein GV055_05645 [Marinomonas mediterranea]